MNSQSLLMGLIALLSLSSCLVPSSGSPTPAIAAVGAPIAEPAPTPTPSPTPVPLSFNAVKDKSFDRSGSVLTITATEITDQRCGQVFTILSTAESAGVVTIETQEKPGSFVYPGHDDCIVFFQNTTVTTSTYNGGACSIGSMVGYRAEYQRYTLTEHAGGLSVERLGYSRELSRNCVGVIVKEREYNSMTSEVYDAL